VVVEAGLLVVQLGLAALENPVAGLLVVLGIMVMGVLAGLVAE